LSVINPKKGYNFIKSYFGKYEEIPEEWSRKSLNEIGKLSAGGTPSTFNDDYWEHGTIPWVTSGEVRNNRIFECNAKITESGLKNSAAKKFPQGTVLIAITGFGKTRGRSSILEIEATTNQSVVGIVVKKEMANKEFVWFVILRQYQNLRNFSQGTQQPGLNLDILKKFKIFLPDNVDEQQKIASILSNIDSLINKTEKVIEHTKRLKKATMQKLLKNGIENKKFKKVKLNQNPYQLNKIPESWDYLRLGETGNFSNGLNKEKKDYGHGCLHVNIDNIFQSFQIDVTKLGKVNATEEEIKRFQLKNNDICLLRSSVKRDGIGFPSIFTGSPSPVVFSGFIIRFRPNEKIWIPQYLAYLLRSHFIRWNVIAYSTVSANTNINQKAYSDIPMPIPPLEEQKKIVTILKNIDSKINHLKSNKNSLVNLKKSLMQKLLTGEIRVKV
jgi:type I restriction enzyme, S subunit